ncbi:MAG TPA: hypothetical protein VK421_15750 [Pyrinomonadaceae bacterium]|nr:hypothetical protein [Pyrinomonadaceae bacterium]
MFYHLKTELIILMLFICSSLVSGSAYAQDSQALGARIIGEPDGISGVECNSIKMYLDFIHIAAMGAGDDQTIIIIARLGRGESSRSLNRQRLEAQRSYLVKNRHFPKEKVVTAEGERVSDLGRIEFYVGGKSHTAFKVKRNNDLVKGCS